MNRRTLFKAIVLPALVTTQGALHAETFERYNIPRQGWHVFIGGFWGDDEFDHDLTHALDDMRQKNLVLTSHAIGNGGVSFIFLPPGYTA